MWSYVRRSHDSVLPWLERFPKSRRQNPLPAWIGTSSDRGSIARCLSVLLLETFMRRSSKYGRLGGSNCYKTGPIPTSSRMRSDLRLVFMTQANPGNTTLIGFVEKVGETTLHSQCLMPFSIRFLLLQDRVLKRNPEECVSTNVPFLMKELVDFHDETLEHRQHSILQVS